MKTLFYTGRNQETKSGVSWKVYKISRQGKRVTMWWGPATIEKRRPVPLYLQSKVRAFRTEDAARTFMAERLFEKALKGYKLAVRARSR